jgi:NHL repeat/WD40-like Beta Propeller Repeat
MNNLDLPRSSSTDTQPFERRPWLLAAVAAILTIAVFAAILTPRAAAVTDAEELVRFGFGSGGNGAGELFFPNKLATDPSTGHVFVAEGHRISEFTPWGKFVKAFGWDVAPGAVNEQQEVRIRAANGQFKLTFGAATTADLSFNAPGAESEGPGSVEAALNALPSINGAVSVEAVPGTADGISPYIYVVIFKGTLAGADVAQLAASSGTTPLSGGSPSTGLEVRTRADGTAGGTGLESCTTESGCKAGVEGDGVGEFRGPSHVKVDSDGNLYVGDYQHARVQKFDSAGRFQLMFGGGVNQTTGADTCTRQDIEIDHDICGGGSEGGGPGEFIKNAPIALGADGTVFIGDKGRIEEFDSDGNFKGEITGENLEGQDVEELEVNTQSGGFYVNVASDQDHVYKLSPSGDTEGSCEVKQRYALAGDADGNLYVSGELAGISGRRVLQLGPSCNLIAQLAEAERAESAGNRYDLRGVAINTVGDLYVTNVSPQANKHFIRAFGPGPAALEAPPKVPPTVDAQFVNSVDRNGAELRAEINPHFWTNTRYYVQYGTGKCSEGGCEEVRPALPGAILGSQPVDAPVRTAGISLEGLQPGTTYYYRFVAQSGGGGPVRGPGGKEGIDGEESTFTTFPAPLPAKTDCPNRAFRSGLSALLPDCRAFEMVTPVDKDNGDIKSLLDFFNFSTALYQSSTNGDKFTYSSYRAFADPKSAPYTVQFIAAREARVGWTSKSIVPAQGPTGNLFPNLENPYKAFSADLCSGWFVMAAEPAPAPGVSAGYPDIYRRDDCGGENYEALVQVKPTIKPNEFYPEFQGASGDGRKAIFRISDKLTADAANGVNQTYYASGGKLHLICVLPDGTPSGDNCSGGTGNGYAYTESNRSANVKNAISDDGSRVYWTASAFDSGAGKVYLRENPDQEQSAISEGECAEVEKACTLKVSETQSSKAARFLAASADGGRALFQVTEGLKKDILYGFSIGAGSTEIAGKVRGLVAADDDLSHVYFVSEEVLDSGAEAGRPNLYLSHDEATTFIAVLSNEDVVLAGGNSNTALEPIIHSPRVSADGTTLAFISTERLSGYDNVDLTSATPASEVYIYEAGAAGPVCVSCNPSGSRPEGRQIPGTLNPTISLQTAASIPPGLTEHHAPAVLSADGSRLFFNSYDALLPRDTNGKEDVYEWERASSPEGCTQLGAELYVGAAQGCLSLISSGESPTDVEFLDASPDGDDVFFTTNASLLPQDPGLIDVYDARVEGGFAQPIRPAPCEGEACQGPFSPPNDPTPASAAFKGAGNVKAEPKSRCAKGKVRRRGRCVAKKQHRKRAGHDRRAAR